MIAYGFLPTLFYTNNMAADKTRYFKDLEMLMEEYKTCYGDCAGDRTIHKLSLLIAMFESSEMFEKIGQKLKTNLIIDIDRDVDYVKWSNLETWIETKSKTNQHASSLTYESLSMDKSLFANSMADMLPPVPETSSDDNKKKQFDGLTYTERDKFKTTINNLMNNNVFNDKVLDFAIDSTLKKLCAALLNIANIIEAKHGASLYEDLYNNQFFAYTNKIGSSVLESHKEWRERYLDDEITEESLKVHAQNALIELFRSGVLDNIEVNVTKKQKDDYKTEIDFSEHDIPKKMNANKLYNCFRSICDFKGGKYSLDKVKAGRLLFKIRKDENKVCAFFQFVLTLTYVYQDIDELRDANRVPSKIFDFDFSQIECKFSEEEGKRSGISKHAPMVLTIMEVMSEKRSKAYWVCFFCVLLEKEWIEDNVNAFCNNMHSIFGVKLDPSAFGKLINKQGIKIEEWDKENKRQKEKREFGLKFKQCIEFYVQYKIDSFT